MIDNNSPPTYEDVATSRGSTLEGVSPETTESAANIANQGSDTTRIFIQLQNVTAALQTLTAEQHALNLELASLKSRVIANEARTLNARIRERNAVATATSSAQGKLEPLYDVRHGGIIPNCPTTELAITKMTNLEASRVLGALGVYYNNDILSPFSDLQVLVRREFISMYKTRSGVR
ncbi:hypothetical protein DL546_008837 [Coniochaeta pulveracea]|uniref:Uncharacterized protein n=1 Tax=Coniochaeta pulveracea TaxID=177199 RepID=A0A420YL47_9PEZI|nr:hypothetical protein DL546_008837 [Coniochaeta pulveracea]